MATATRKREFGNGSIYFAEKENARIGTFTAGRKPNGKPDDKKVRGKTETEARRKLTSMFLTTLTLDIGIISVLGGETRHTIRR